MISSNQRFEKLNFRNSLGGKRKKKKKNTQKRLPCIDHVLLLFSIMFGYVIVYFDIIYSFIMPDLPFSPFQFNYHGRTQHPTQPI